MKVDFIICTNSDLWFSECERYIENLIVPENFEISILGITEASGMAEGYEEGRNSSEADYKVYLHQDVFIINRHFIEDIDAIFRADDRIGIIGVLGNDDVHDQSFNYGTWKWGETICCNGTRQLRMGNEKIAGQYNAADCLDGMILATRYDVPWREDIFTGWHFYDRSVCLEYKRRGYLCVVPRQEFPWCIHACGASDLIGWNDSLSVYLNEYQDFLQTDKVLENMELPDQDKLRKLNNLADQVERLINQRKLDEAAGLVDKIVYGTERLNKRLTLCRNLLEIGRTGDCRQFFMPGDNVSDMQSRYIRAYFLLQRKCGGLLLDVEETRFLAAFTDREKAVIMRHELTLYDQVRESAEGFEEILTQALQKAQMLLDSLTDGSADMEKAALSAVNLAVVVDSAECKVPIDIYEKYSEFFAAFSVFCKNCGNVAFLLENKGELASSLDLFLECMEAMGENYISKSKKCPCCGHEVIYRPLPDYYGEMAAHYGVTTQARNETLNEEEYYCPDCGASDRDRLIVSFLEKEGLQEAVEGFKLLQIAPAAAISRWINTKCPHIQYDTTDLYMDQVTFHSDVMDMNTVPDATYDAIICSHVLEHVRDDRKALSELKRILKPDGKVIFLVPIDLNATCIDEEWGLSEAENWRRFGQGDHCRRYDKGGLIQRLEEQFCVHSLGKEYFGEELFARRSLTDTSTLYVLTKSRQVSLNMAEEVVIDERLCREGPLVSVVMSCYNHAPFVADAIESVIGQSYKNIEFLVADDGSSDDSVEVMKRYSEYFTEEHYFEDNIGERFTLLMNRSRGKYIALINSDDLWEKDKLALQVKYMEEHEECEVCFTWAKYADENLVELKDDIFVQRNRSSSEWMKYFWQHGNALCHPASLSRRELRIIPPQYGSACWQLPDFFKWVDLIQSSSIYIIPKFLTVMRRYDRSGVQNTSAYTNDNMRRHLVEEGHNWFWIIRNMEAAFFKEAFGEFMINPHAFTEQEIKCEKYFLMLSHRNPYTRNNALCYFFEIYNDVKSCMRDKYAYTIKEFKEDVLRKGLV